MLHERAEPHACLLPAFIHQRSSFLFSNHRASSGLFSLGPRNMVSLVNRGLSTVGAMEGIHGLLHWPCNSTGRAENITQSMV